MCCGRSRQQYLGTSNQNRVGAGLTSPGYAGTHPAPAVAVARGVPVVAARAKAAGPVFEYVGRTGLTAASPVTGNRYRFDRAGARLVVDPRDSRWLLSVPNLSMIARR
jgi:hypothetical protein